MVVTLDSNIWISALVFRKGNAHELLKLALDGRIDIAITDAILQETLRVLKDKFHLPPEDLHESEEIIKSCTHRVSPGRVIDAVPDDPDDNRILECAEASGSQFIITGDKDLLRVAQFEGIHIIRLSDFLPRDPNR